MFRGYCYKDTLEAVRNIRPTVGWWQVVVQVPCILMDSIVSTKDRLLSRGLITNNECLFCGSAKEDHVHPLLFML